MKLKILNKSNIRIITVILCVCFFLSGHSQNNQRSYYKNLDIKNGLSQNCVQCILQDKMGFMWFGTKNGLNRYDGVDFKIYNASEDCRSLFEDTNGIIWIGTDKGVYCYNSIKESMQKFEKNTKRNKKITNTVTKIIDDNHGKLWFLVDNQGVFSYDKKTGELNDYPLTNESVKKRNVTTIAFEPSGRIWLGFFWGGLIYSDDNLKTTYQFTDDENQAVFSSRLITKIELHSNNLYVGTENLGIKSIDLASRHVTDVFVSDSRGPVSYIRDFVFTSPYEMCIGTENGLYTLNMLSREYRHDTHSVFDPYSLSDNAIYAITKDREDDLWIGTYFGGVNYLSQENARFDKYYQNGLSESLHGQRVRRFCEDKNGNIWIGTEDGGLNRFNPKTNSFKYIEASRNFSNVHGLCAVNGNLWVGAFGKGLKILDVNSGAVTKTYSVGDNSGIASNYIFSICRTSKGDLYIGTMSGLQRYDASKNRFETLARTKDIFIYDIIEGSDGSLWLATYADGLFCYNPQKNTWNNFKNKVGVPGSILSDRVLGVFQDNKKNIWALTQNGMCRFDAKSRNFDSSIHSKDFPRQLVCQMLEDDKGYFWISTNHGLYCIDSKSFKVYNYEVSDGLLSNQFNYSSSFKSKWGKLYFGSIEGFVAFNPMNIKVQPKLPRPIIVEMWVFNKRIMPTDDGSVLSRSISMTDKVELDYDDNSLAFTVVIPSYKARAKHKIKYKLEGLDKGWNYLPSGYNRISFSNLGFGTYKLIVVGYIDNDENNGVATELEIEIKPPFYCSIWAYIFYLLFLGACVYMMVRYYRYRNLRKTQKHIAQYKQEKEREIYAAKFEFFTNVAHEIRTPLTLIKVPLDTVVKACSKAGKEVRESLDIMNLNVDRLLLLVNQLLDFRKVESRKYQLKKNLCSINKIIEDACFRFVPTAKSEGIELTLKMPEEPLKAIVDSEALTKILSNLFVNAIKYGKSYVNIELKISGNGSSFSIIVANDGNVIAVDKREEVFMAFARLRQDEEKTGAGIGLSFARSLAQLHGGTLTMGDSIEENVFILTIPFENDEPIADNDNDEELLSLASIVKRNEHGVRILVVEDNMDMQKLISQQLTSSGFLVFTANNGKAALSALGENMVDVVVSDVKMPEMDGFELCAKIKTDIDISHIPVILLTARTDMEDRIKGLELGADAYIVKPFQMDYLIANIRTNCKM